LDKSCLDLCISLLDHDLTGDLFESVAVGFLAVQGIDVDKLILKEACNYGACLSGFIKIAQMLVVQKAVVMIETGKAECPSHMINEMRERFMIQGSRSPFNWACRLRMYAKKIRDSTTCLGYITWTDDGQKVLYKNVRDLSMVGFQTFVRTEVEKCQYALEELLLLHPQERREDLNIAVSTYKLVDNPAENRNEWSFLQHNENLLGPLPDRRSWLLDRVLSNEWLYEEFLGKDAAGKTVWRYGNAKAYKEKVTRFLELLLLLIHLTSGQPARRTEILSIRYMNTVHGHHRNIFIENGMVSTVTSYYKGYNVTGSTKIIHRYLPKEVGELLVYYLWLILPFCQQLELLAFRNSAQTSPFLWAKDKGGDAWDSSQLSRVMRREFELELGLPIGLSVYRHLAIAISRKHLPCGGFKRDYGLEDTNLDTQSSHSSWTAGSVYARGLQEAAGHVDMRNSEYRSISRQWHEFLGFLPTSLPSRKRRLGDISGYDSPQEKRTRIINP
jgi:hypothetical protein